MHPPPCPEFQTCTVKPSFLCGCWESELRTSLLVQQAVYSLSCLPNPKLLIFYKSIYVCMLACSHICPVNTMCECSHLQYCSILPSLVVKPVLSILKVPEASTPTFAFAGLGYWPGSCWLHRWLLWRLMRQPHEHRLVLASGCPNRAARCLP